MPSSGSPSTCLYCSFTSYSIDQFENIVQDYLEALLKELDFVAKTYAHKELQTMYIGGGTPTSLKEEDLEYLLYEVNKSSPQNPVLSIKLKIVLYNILKLIDRIRCKRTVQTCAWAKRDSYI